MQIRTSRQKFTKCKCYPLYPKMTPVMLNAIFQPPLAAMAKCRDTYIYHALT